MIDNALGLRRTELTTGMSVLTNLDVNDPCCPRLASAVPPFETVAKLLAEEPPVRLLVERLAEVLGNHEGSLDPAGRNPLSRLCIHGGQYGTRSSSIIVLEKSRRVVRYFHADGPPCSTPFDEVAV